ncbi:hypothetical protein C0991_000600, partial [Blastosporella zonata]
MYWGSTSPNTEEWHQCDAYAQSLVTLNVVNPIGQGVAMDGTAATTWKSLTEQHDAKSDLALLNAKEALSNIQYSKETWMPTLQPCALRGARQMHREPASMTQ